MMQPTVYLIGAGPGDPGLITARGLDYLRRADVVITCCSRLLNSARLGSPVSASWKAL